ncbi:hypothetical protein C1701_23690 [Actinoalloteichus sp. AHMU CJ021]|nr:hypothetical protein C1701_23690 [Actinoalloteichus sp. AHMU CJ021]
MALAVAGRGHRIDRMDLPPGLAQCGNQQTTWGLDRHRDRLGRIVTSGGEHDQQLGGVGGGVVELFLAIRPPSTSTRAKSW